MEPANILKIETLDEGWSDKDNIMLHACFQLLTNCIEKEDLIKNTNWDQDEEYKNAKDEIEELYSWWKKRVESEKEDRISAIWTKDQYQIDNQKLTKLICIRKFLWT